jgi:hypothetical protein
MVIDENYILNNKVEFGEVRSGIYFLIKDNKVVYVGQSIHGLSRIFTHKDKDFDFYCFIKCSKEKLNKYEALNIFYYKPKYNKTLNEEFFSIEMIRNRLKKVGIKSPYFYKNNIKKIIKEKNIKTYNFNFGCIYIDSCDFDLILKEVQL